MSVVAKTTEIVVALAGNPNSGKTTVFNELTGSHQHVGNWPGVTVEHKEGITHKNNVTVRVIDLPGIYSLSTYSQEEVVARDFLLDNHVDVIINVVDASNIERNLYLTAQLLELGIPMVVALNMVDMARKMGQEMDLKKFAQFLGVEVVPTVGSRGKGMDEILERAIHAAECPPPRSAKYRSEIEKEVGKLESMISLNLDRDCLVPIRWFLIKALEGDTAAKRRLAKYAVNEEETMHKVESTRRHLEQHFGHDLESVIADDRYGFVGGLMREVITRTANPDRVTITDRLDNILLHRFWGIPIFLGLMWLTFKLTFDVGGVFSSMIDGGVAALGMWAAHALPPGPLSSLVVKGIISGVGGVIVFLPNIIVIFIIIGFLEDSGYMARAAFLMDRAMHVLGLHGKSFIPMLMGFGCNVPAVMATRTLDTPEDRLVTILINPLMSCTARLPIYILFAGAFFSRNGAMVIFSIYALGVILAVIMGKLFRKVLFPRAVSPFVMELPPYRMPTVKGTIMHVWERSAAFLSKAGTVILAASVIIWALGSLPWGTSFGSNASFVGHIGRALEPIVRPLGLDWKAAVALLFGLGAKEIVVSTMGVFYGFGDSSMGEKGLQAAIAKAYTPLSGYVFMVVSLIYIPCIATIAAIKRETNSWKWTLFAVGYSLALAYGMGLLVHTAGLAMGFK